MNAQLRFSYSSHSANCDTYTCSDPGWYATALWMDFQSVTQPGGGRRMLRLRPARYSVTVMRLGSDKWVEATRFTYTPSRNPKDMHLPDRTITRLIRQHLATPPSDS